MVDISEGIRLHASVYSRPSRTWSRGCIHMPCKCFGTGLSIVDEEELHHYLGCSSIPGMMWLDIVNKVDWVSDGAEGTVIVTYTEYHNRIELRLAVRHWPLRQLPWDTISPLGFIWDIEFIIDTYVDRQSTWWLKIPSSSPSSLASSPSSILSLFKSSLFNLACSSIWCCASFISSSLSSDRRCGSASSNCHCCSFGKSVYFLGNVPDWLTNELFCPMISLQCWQVTRVFQNKQLTYLWPVCTLFFPCFRLLPRHLEIPRHIASSIWKRPSPPRFALRRW